MNLKPFLSADYQGFESFRDNVLAPIFGADNIDESQRYDWLDIDSEYRVAAHRANIVEAWLMAKIDIGDSEFHVYDITVGYGSHLAQSRVGIRNFITNSILPTYANAFIIFHYADTAGRPWRFSYVYKGASGSDTTEAHRFTYLFGQGIPCRTAEERFNTLHDGEINDTTLRKAFSVEALSDEFFYKYLGYYASFVKYFTGKPTAKERGEKAITDRNFRQVVSEMDSLGIANTDDQYHTDFLPHFGGDEQLAEKGVRDYVKKMMGRIVFLHFLQKKGWMGVPCDRADWTGGDENFMWHLYEHATDEQRDDLLDKVLEPLFFGMLNTKPEERAALFAECGWDTSLLVAWQKVPYLNGGLFEREAIDELPSRFPKEYFERFLSFLGEYNFTIDENDPNDAEVGVDPEMLGKIFESLLEDNKDKGAYYTPKEIVQYMCRESVAAYLKAHADDNRSELELLQQVKVCDPAIGSGAFPMGILNELYHRRIALGETDRADIKREIIQQNIYGVDLEQGAVDIARLRFWLAIVVDAEQPEPLPNLDYKIMQGNSLLESYEGFDMSNLATINDVRIIEPQRNLFGELDDPQLVFSFSRSSVRDELRDLINRVFSEENHDERNRVRSRINEIVRHTLAYNIEQLLSGALQHVNNLSAISNRTRSQELNLSVQQALVEKYQRLMVEVEEMEIPNDKFFLWHTWFADVFQQGGFDIVIGNPPYIEAKKLKHIACTLKTYFEVYTGTSDISAYFIELGTMLAKQQGGVLNYITTNKFFNTGYGKSVRKHLLDRTINQLINFEQVEVFEGVLVSSVILMTTNQPPQQTNNIIYERFYKLNAYQFRQEFVQRTTYGTYQQAWLDENEWAFSDAQALILKQKIESNGIAIRNIEGVSVYRGVTTGYNPAFIINDTKREELIAADPNNRQIIKKLLQGRNIRKWYYNESEEYLIFTRKGTNIDIYPYIKAHLYDFYNNLKPRSGIVDNEEGRKPGNYKWFEILDNTAYYQHFEKPKIIWGLTADKWAYTIDRDNHYLPSNGYIMTSEELSLEYLLGVLNSKVLHYYFSFIGVMTAGGAYTLKAATIESLPIPTATPEQQQPIISLVEIILEKKRNGEPTEQEEREIDLLVYRLYGLTEDEIRVIESQ